MNRRRFFQSLIGATGFLTVATLLKSNTLQAEERRRGGGAAATAKGPELVDPKSAPAKQVSYVHKHSDLKDKKLMLDRQGVKWADQKCKNCAFYINRDKDNKVNGMDVGGCSMPFAKDKVIANEGWCSTWAKKG